MSLLPFPSFYDPAQVDQLYLERGGQIADEADRYAAAHHVRPAAEDRERIAAFGIDVQVAFCIPGASLFVPGAVEDTRRTLAWLYGNLGRITELVFSLDAHRVFQIFHPAWWVDAAGKHPPPLTAITADDVARGRWRPMRNPDDSLEYCRKLEATGKYVLTIWPYHTLVASLSNALVPAVREASIFHTLVRAEQPFFAIKGEEPLTESYSVLAPEVRELGGRKVGFFDAPLLSRLLAFDRVYVFGQAKSHCVLATLEDIRLYAEANDPSLTGKFYVLEDAMSPVPAPPLDPLPPALDFPRVADAAMERFRRAGMHVVRTTDPV